MIVRHSRTDSRALHRHCAGPRFAPLDAQPRGASEVQVLVSRPAR